tara:strand:+ start:826 stop:960 length:135 start_codon:yes stop_codon:yes gene_type:complete
MLVEKKPDAVSLLSPHIMANGVWSDLKVMERLIGKHAPPMSTTK